MRHRFVAVHLRHHDVHQDNVEVRALIQRFQGFAAVVGKVDIEAQLFQLGGQRVNIAHVVVHQQQLFTLENVVAVLNQLRVAAPVGGQGGFQPVQEQGRLIKQPFVGALGLENNTVGVLAQPRFLVAGQVLAGIDHHRHRLVVIVAVQALQQLEAAHVRQCQIQDHAIIDGVTEGFECRLAAGDGGDLNALLVEQLADAFMLDSAVLHHQQAPHIGLDGGFDLGEGAEHLLLADRLGEEVDGAQIERLLALVLAGQKVHRNILGAGVRLELLHHLPAVDAGQPDIENNGAGPVAARVLETGFTVVTDVAFQAVIRRQVHQYVGELAVVLDHQHGLFADHEAVVVLAFQRQIGGGVRLGVGADVHRFRRRRPGTVLGLLALPGVPLGQVEHEGGAGAGAVAVQADFAAQQTRQLPRDGQPQAGAAVFAAGGAVGLLEGLEDQLLLVLGDAHAGVGDREFKRAGTVHAAGNALVLAGALDA